MKKTEPIAVPAQRSVDGDARSSSFDASPGSSGGQPPRIPDYELLRRIGGGSYGEVWLARNVLGDCRAVKIVYRSTFEDERPFEREFEGIKRFEPISRSHPSQLNILHVGRGEGCFYYVMELADDANAECGVRSAESSGQRDSLLASTANDAASTIPHSEFRTPHSYVSRTLKHELQRRGHLPPAECVEIGLALTTALAHLHSHGLVHRDIKPSNIIFVQGRPKLADIGLVTDVDASRSFVGTEGFLPPEGPGTPQADLYGLGKVLYEMFSGKDRKEFPALPPDLREWPDAEASVEFNAVVLKACAADVRDRYTNAGEMAADLERLQKGSSVKGHQMRKRMWAVAQKVCLAIGAFCAVMWAGHSLFLQRQVSERGTTNQQAFAEYELGRYFFNKMNTAANNKAIEHFEKAAQLDPNFALPYAGLVDCYVWDPSFSSGTNPAKLRAAAEKLLALDRRLPEGHLAMAVVDWLALKWADSEAGFNRALALRDNYAAAHTLYAFYLACRGRFEEATNEVSKAEQIEPTSISIRIVRGNILLGQGELPAAIQHLNKVLEMETDSYAAHGLLAVAYLAQGDFLRAIDHLETGDFLKSYDQARTKESHDMLRKAFRESGAKGYWEARLPQLDAKNGRWWHAATILAGVGRTQDALDRIEQAVREKDAELVVLKLHSRTTWKNISSEPRFLELLKRAGFDDSSSTAFETKSIAVLPFDNDSPEKTDGYLGSEIVEELSIALARISGLRVFGRYTAAALKAAANSQEVAAVHNVRTILYGRVRKYGAKLRVAVQLMDTGDGRQLWSKVYDREMSEIFGIESDIAENVAQALHITLTDTQRPRLAMKSTKNLEAYQSYLEGRFFLNQRGLGPESAKKALAYFEKAIALDADFALGHAGLAECLWWLAIEYTIPSPKEAYEKARQAAERALQIDPGVAEAHTALAIVKRNADRDWAAAESHFKQAVALDPNSALTRDWYAGLLVVLGRPEEAVAQSKQAQTADPFSPLTMTEHGAILYYARRFDEAIRVSKELVKMNPTFNRAHFQLWRAYLPKGLYDDAITAQERFYTAVGASGESIRLLRKAYEDAGMPGYWQARLKQLLRVAENGPIDPVDIAAAYAALGESDRAFEWLEKANNDRSSRVIFLKVDAMFDNLRADLRYAELVKKLRLDN